MKKIFLPFIILLLSMSWSNPSSGQEFVNVRVNHLTENRQAMYGGNALAVYDNTIYALWTDQWAEGTMFTYVSVSTDDGATFQDGINVSSEGIQVFSSLAVDEEGTVYATWVGTPDGEMMNGIYFAKSTDGGSTFSEQLEISPTGGFPHIAVYGEHVYIFYINIDITEDDMPAWPVAYHFIRSTNGGDSFEAPSQVNDVELLAADVRMENPNTIHVGEDGTIYVAWTDGRRTETGTDIYLARSTDSGVSFGSNVMVNDPDSYSGYDRFGVVVDVLNSDVHAAWLTQDEENLERRIIFSKSTDGGASFGQDVDISYGQGTPALKVSRDGFIYLAYPEYRGEDEEGMYLSISTDGGERFPNTRYINDLSASAKNPSIFVESGENDTVYLLWTDNRSNDDDIFFAKGEINKDELKETTSAGDFVELPGNIILHQNYPNPFNPMTTIQWEMDAGRHVNIRVFDMLGREKALLTDQYFPAGVHWLPFDASMLSSGVYIYRLEAGSVRSNRKMTFLK